MALTTWLPVAALGLILGGCASSGFDVVGGTERERHIVRTARDGFLDASGLDVSWVPFEFHADWHAAGSWNGQRVALREGLPEHGLVSTVWHELGHAADGVVEGALIHHDLWAGIEVAGGDVAPVARNPAEAVANTLELGPLTLARLARFAEACGGEDDALRADTFAALVFDAWEGEVTGASLASLASVHGVWPAPDGWSVLEAIPVEVVEAAGPKRRGALATGFDRPVVRVTLFRDTDTRERRVVWLSSEADLGAWSARDGSEQPEGFLEARDGWRREARPPIDPSLPDFSNGESIVRLRDGSALRWRGIDADTFPPYAGLILTAPDGTEQVVTDLCDVRPEAWRSGDGWVWLVGADGDGVWMAGFEEAR